MTRKTQRLIRKVFPYISVLLIAGVILLGVLLFTKNDDNTDATKEADTTSAEVIEVTETTTEEETGPTISAVDAMHVDALVDRYYEAKLSDNAEDLNSIVDTDRDYTVADLADETQFISKYDNFKTYSLPGPTDNYFIVYVTYDIYFNGINTGAPSLNHFIITKDSDGYYYIYDRELSGEFQAYLEETERSEVVMGLKKQVEDELEAACESNEDLKYLIAMLNERPAGADPASEEETSEASVEAAETESTAE